MDQILAAFRPDLFAGKQARFDEIIEPWPIDVRDHARKLAAAACS